MDYPFSVFMAFTKAAGKAESNMLKVLLGVIRVGASDDDKRCKQMWKELSRG